MAVALLLLLLLVPGQQTLHAQDAMSHLSGAIDPGNLQEGVPDATFCLVARAVG